MKAPSPQMGFSRAKRKSGAGKVLSFLFSSQCIASASFVFLYVIFIHLALLYTEELKHHKGLDSSIVDVRTDLSGFLGSRPAKQGRRIHQMQVKSEELKAAFGDLQGLNRKVKFSLPGWAFALGGMSFEGKGSPQKENEFGGHSGGQSVKQSGGQSDGHFGGQSGGQSGGHFDGHSVGHFGGQSGGQSGGEDPSKLTAVNAEDASRHNLSQATNGSSIVLDKPSQEISREASEQDPTLGELRPEDTVKVEQIVDDLLTAQQEHEKAAAKEAEPEGMQPYVEQLPEDTMEGILLETALFLEERERSLARLSSFEPVDEEPPELGPHRQQRDEASEAASRSTPVLTGPPVDPILDEARQFGSRHLLGLSSEEVPFGATPPCAEDMSALDPFGFVQASIQKAFDTGSGLVPGPAKSFECEMTFDGQGQRCVDREVVMYTLEEARELSNGVLEESETVNGASLR